MTPTTTFAAATSAERPELAAKLFRALGGPTQLRLVWCSLDGEQRVVDLVAVVGLAQSTVSAHLAWLRDGGLLNRRTVGRQSYYRLSHDVQEPLLDSETLLSRTGHEVSLRPTSAHPPSAGTP